MSDSVCRPVIPTSLSLRHNPRQETPRAGIREDATPLPSLTHSLPASSLLLCDWWYKTEMMNQKQVTIINNKKKMIEWQITDVELRNQRKTVSSTNEPGSCHWSTHSSDWSLAVIRLIIWCLFGTWPHIWFSSVCLWCIYVHTARNSTPRSSHKSQYPSNSREEQQQ